MNASSESLRQNKYLFGSRQTEVFVQVVVLIYDEQHLVVDAVYLALRLIVNDNLVVPDVVDSLRRLAQVLSFEAVDHHVVEHVPGWSI